MLFVPIGMSEVPSCIIDPSVRPGYHVVKGEKPGYFQFGGSTQLPHPAGGDRRLLRGDPAAT